MKPPAYNKPAIHDKPASQQRKPTVGMGKL
jgi:hypothetical protein